MKKWLLSILMIIFITGIVACGDKDESDEKNTDKVTEVVTNTPEASTPAPTEEVTPEPTPTEVPTEAPTEAPTEVPTEAPTEVPTEIPTEAPTEAPLENGNNEINEAALAPAFEAYKTYLSNANSNLEIGFERLKFGVGYVDEDDIPELFVAVADYHAAGVDVIKYDEATGEAVCIGGFGSYGEFAYNPFNNRIISFYYGMGYEDLMHYSIVDMKPELIAHTLYDDNDFKFYVNDEEVDFADYDAAHEELLSYSDTNRFFRFASAIEYTEDLDIDTVLRDMATAELNNEYYFPPVSFDVSEINGDWALFTVTSIDSATETEKNTWDYENASGMLYLDLDVHNSFWASFDDETYIENDLTYTLVNESLDDTPGFADWYIELKGETSNDEYYATLFTEDGQNYVFFRHITLVSDTDTITYDMVMYRDVADDYEEWDYATINFDEIASDLDNGYAAFTAWRYEYVSSTDTDLIEAYGLPEDLDGYDYVMVRPDDEPFTLYVPTNSDASFSILNFDDGLNNVSVTYDEFMEYLSETHYGEMPVLFTYDGSYNDCVLSLSLAEDYTG